MTPNTNHEGGTRRLSAERQLLNVKTAFLQSAEKECDELKQALREVAEHELEDGTFCWCMEQPTERPHADYCERARDLLVEPQLPSVTTTGPQESGIRALPRYRCTRNHAFTIVSSNQIDVVVSCPVLGCNADATAGEVNK